MAQAQAQASPQHSSEHSAKEYDETEDIPTVDFDLLARGTADQRSRAVADIGRACEDWGFFMVTNHGVPESLREAMLDACKDLFDLASEEKAEYKVARPMDPIRMGSGFNADDARYCREYVKMFAHPELHCPPKPPMLSAIAKEFSARTRVLAVELVRAISESLGLDGGRISEALDLGACFQILVGNLYPPCPRPGGVAEGLPSHSDHGLLTLLFQSGAVHGLQVKHNGRWVPVKPLPNSFLVLAGDQLEIVTNGRYGAVLHRAVVGGEKWRMSFVSLIGPCLDTVVEPIPELAAGDGRRLEFRGIKYREYMKRQQSSKLDEKSALDLVRVHHQ